MLNLTYEDFKKLSDQSEFESDKADVIAKCLKDVVFISDTVMYSINENLTVTMILDKDSENYLLNAISKLMSKSFKMLNEEQKELLSKHCKGFNSVKKNSGIRQYLPQLYCALAQDIDFDKNKNEIHFNNGFIDVTDLEFKQRVAPNYVSSCIPRDYKKSSKKSKKYIQTIIDQIYPIEDDRETVLSILGSSFSGSVVNDRTSLFLLGKSSAGKSVIMKMLLTAFSDCYVKEFSSDTFEKFNKNANKIFNQFLKSRNVRISWVNELSSSRTDISLFKKFCEGQLQTVSLYKDGINSVVHNSKVVLTSNEMPNLQIDTGVSSRILAYNHISKFVDSLSEVDESKHHYKGDKKLIDKLLVNSDYKNAIIDIILQYTTKYLKDGKVEYSKAFTTAKDDIVNANDYIQDYIDSTLIQTDDTKDRIGKNQMLELYKATYPDKRMNVQSLIGALKDKGIEYSSQYRYNNIRGCFVCIKLKDEDESDAVNYSGVSKYKYDKMKTENDDLKRQLEELKQQLEPKETKVITTKKTKTKKVKTNKKVIDLFDNFIDL